jgi:hypothetical protein
MRETCIENKTDMFVVERIEHLATFAARLYQIRRTQNAQLMTDHRLFQIQFFGDIVYRDFARKHQMDNADASRVAKELEEFGKFKKGIQSDILCRKDLFVVVMGASFIFNI